MMNRTLLLVGAIQGWMLWALWKARELQIWPATNPICERALLYISLALPLGFYLTQNILSLSRTLRIKLLIGVGILFALLGGYSGWADNVHSEPLNDIWSIPPARPSDLLAAAILGFIIIPLLVHFKRSKEHWSYQSLFETSWRNVLLTSSSAALTGVFWIVLLAGAMLMKSVGLNFIYDLIEKPIFSFPATGIVYGASFALGLVRVEMIVVLRRYWLSISAWLLPLLLFFSLMWVVALPFTGLHTLFKTHNAGFILLWFLALSIQFANAAYQDGEGEQPYGRLLAKTLEYAWLSLLVLAVVAWWAMKLRIDQYGWTEERVWGVFVLLLATIYTVGYAYSVRLKTGWLVNIGNTNVFTALVMCIGILILLSPLGDARRIAVHSQVSRIKNGNTASENIDYAYLRWQAGRYGQDALNTLAGGINHKDKEFIASKAKQVLAQKQRYSNTSGAEKLTIEQVRQRLRALPKGTVLDDELIKSLQSATHWPENTCMEINTKCAIWMVDLNNDGLKEAVLIPYNSKWSSGNAVFYHQLAKNQYEFGGAINLGYWGEKNQLEKMMAEIELGHFKVVAPKFNDIELGNEQIKVIAK